MSPFRKVFVFIFLVWFQKNRYFFNIKGFGKRRLNLSFLLFFLFSFILSFFAWPHFCNKLYAEKIMQMPLVDSSIHQAKSLFKKGLQEQRRGKDNLALIYYEKALALDQNLDGAVNNMAILLSHRDNHLAARQLWHSLAMQDSATYGYNNALMRLKSSAPGEQIVALQAMVSEFPGDFRLSMLLAFAYLQNKEYHNAKRQYKHSLKIDSQSYDAWNNLACSQILLAEYGPALDNLSRALAIDDKKSTAYYNTALTYYMMEYHDKANIFGQLELNRKMAVKR